MDGVFYTIQNFRQADHRMKGRAIVSALLAEGDNEPAEIAEAMKAHGYEVVFSPARGTGSLMGRGHFELISDYPVNGSQLDLSKHNAAISAQDVNVLRGRFPDMLGEEIFQTFASRGVDPYEIAYAMREAGYTVEFENRGTTASLHGRPTLKFASEQPKGLSLEDLLESAGV